MPKKKYLVFSNNPFSDYFLKKIFLKHFQNDFFLSKWMIASHLATIFETLATLFMQVQLLSL